MLAFFLFLVMPSETYSQTVNWFSGFTNYILSFLLTGIYIRITFKILFTDYVPKNNFLMFFFALAGGLCVENITIYNFIYSIAIIFLIKNRKKKIYSCSIFYLAGAILAVAMMFFNSTYSQIISTDDKIGVRNFEFSFSDIYTNMYKDIIPHYAKSFFIVHIIIAISMLTLYLRKEKQAKYEKICIYICIFYAVYSVFVSWFADFTIISASMRIRAFEGVFVALYLLSLIYLSITALHAESATRFIIYLVSSLIVTAPFIVVSPMTPRCIFADYLFWILATGELFLTAFRNRKFNDIMFMFPLAMSIIITGINITNNYYDNIRFNYAKKQFDNNSKIIYLVKLPYPDYAYEDFDDTLFFKILDNNNSYGKYIFRYHGIEINPDEHKFIFISPEDYLLMKDA